MTTRSKALGAFSIPKRTPTSTPDEVAVDRIAAAVAGDEPVVPAPPPPRPTHGTPPTVLSPPSDDAPVLDDEALEPTKSPEGKAGGYRRRKGVGERVTLYLTPKVKRAAELRCLRERRSLSDAVEAALAEWLRSPKAP